MNMTGPPFGHAQGMVRLNDDANLTPSDFAVDIPVLPYYLKDNHKMYEEIFRARLHAAVSLRLSG